MIFKIIFVLIIARIYWTPKILISFISLYPILYILSGYLDVLTKIHGGGATDRKRKLLEKQKKGKARSKQFGRVEIPQEAFIGVLKINKEK